MTKLVSPKKSARNKRNEIIVTRYQELKEEGNETMGIVEAIKKETGVSVASIFRIVREWS